jgi:hypothetical protein
MKGGREGDFMKPFFAAKNESGQSSVFSFTGIMGWEKLPKTPAG